MASLEWPSPVLLSMVGMNNTHTNDMMTAETETDKK